MESVSHLLLFFLTTSFARADTLPEASTNLVLLSPPTNVTFQAPLLNFSSSTFPSNLTLSATSSAAATNLVPRFNETVHDAVLSTTARYWRAVIVEICANSAVGPTTNPDTLTDVQLIFSYHVGQYRSISVTMGAWGQWNEPRLTRSPPPANTGPLPLNLGMDIVLADILLKKAGYTQDYDAVDVRWPTSYTPRNEQVYYFFHMEGGTHPVVVAVGTRDRRVTPWALKPEAAEGTAGEEMEMA